MKLFNLASSQSFWRGIEYCNTKKVKTYNILDSTHLQGEVQGSNGELYHVYIDSEHPKKSTCTCPNALGRKVVCKHMIALYYTAYPEKKREILAYIDAENERYQIEEEQRIIQEKSKIRKYVMSLSKQELQEELLERMLQELDEHDFYR